jgi:hypothetical protein
MTMTMKTLEVYFTASLDSKTHETYEDIKIFVLRKAICNIALKAIVQPY